MIAAVKEKSELSLFVKREIDDYGLDPYEFRIYARITRRAGKSEAWESVNNMASACCMSLSRARRALHLLRLAKLIESIERPGYSTLYRLNPHQKWVESDRLQELRSFINLRAKSPTPIRCDRGTRNDSPITFSSTPLSDVIPLPLSEVIDEGIPCEGISFKVLPQSPLTPQREKMGQGQEREIRKESLNSTSPNNLLYLSQQLAQSLTDALKPVLESFVTETRSVLLEIKERSPFTSQSDPKSHPRGRTKSSPTSSDSTCLSKQETAKTLEELARLVSEPVDSLYLNSNLTNALSEYPDNVEPTMLYFKQAVATWKKRPGLGLFISALKKGLKPSPTAPGGGWGDWANEATKRRLMQYSQSYDGDIMVHFASGIQKLWSEVRHLDWAEIEALVANPVSGDCA